MKKFLIVLFFLILSTSVYASDAPIYYFYGDGCPHCAALKPFLESMESKYEIDVVAFETWKNSSNADLFIQMSAACGKSVVGVPTIFIGHKAIIGYDNENNKGKEIEEAIKHYLEDPSVDLMKNIGQNLTECPDEHEGDDSTIFTLPIIGTIDASRMSLPMLTVIIGLLDGFNPCAMWVLMFLLALLVHSKSRKRMFMIGGIFILVSGIVYYFFMAAWLNLYMIIGFLPILRLLVGAAAIIIGFLNIKELFWFKKGPSLTISDKAKPKIFKRMRRVVNEQNILAAIIGVSILAFTVNAIELLCTAGFPAIYTKILTLNGLSPIQYYLYLVLYIIMYMLDDTLVFLIAVWTLNQKKMSQKQGKWLKLISGAMMLVLGLLLVFKPDLLMFG